MFYGDLEKTHLNTFIGKEELLVRWVDDFLFMTPDKDKFTAFISRMHQGFPDYGCEVNSAKTVVNCGVTLNGKILERVVRSQTGNCEFPWCGMLINDRTLEVRADHRQAKEEGKRVAVFENKDPN